MDEQESRAVAFGSRGGTRTGARRGGAIRAGARRGGAIRAGAHLPAQHSQAQTVGNRDAFVPGFDVVLLDCSGTVPMLAAAACSAHPANRPIPYAKPPGAGRRLP